MKSHKRWLAIPLTILLLTGCGLTGTTTGSKTTKVYNEKGEVKKVVVEDVALGDKNTNYNNAVTKVAEATAEGIKIKVNAITQATASDEGDSEGVKAWKQSTRVIAITNIKDTTAHNINAIHYGKDGYDVADNVVNGLPGAVMKTVVGFKGLDVTEKVLTKGFEEAGDNTTVEMGEGNTIGGMNKSAVSNENHATAMGQDSSPSVSGPTPTSTISSAPEEKEFEVLEEPVE